MELLKKKILTEGRIYPGDVLKVDSFLNHQIDTAFVRQIGEEFCRRFGDCNVTKILTIEASGIAVGFAVSEAFGDIPVVFAKKGEAANMADGAYHASCYSYTRKADYIISVSREYLKPEDRVLIIDDFLANGAALKALMDIVRISGCQLVGAGVVIEKAYQPGGEWIRSLGVRVESLARISHMDPEDGISFAE